DNTFAETDFYKKQVITDSPYALTKFLAEKAVLEAMGDGLDAIIIRVGNLTNRYSDLKCMTDYRNNRFNAQIKTIMKLNTISENIAESELTFSPIDDVAKGIVRLTQYRAAKHTAFHLYSSDMVPFKILLKAFEKVGIIVEYDAGSGIELNEISDSNIRNELYNLLAVTTYERKVQATNSRNDFTLNYLRRIGFEFKVIDENYIDEWVASYDEMNYWKE
ncbi:MAG: hypothetical protein GX638_04925, partial [Crenarchaeota archaeon]|nr:hypothetical protein [Thermoproteota archaeon]